MVTMDATAAVDVSVIIISYNTKRFIGTCLEALLERTRDVALETIVVDNASADGSVEMIRSRFPGVILVENSANLGYARAVNQGIARSGGRYFLVLNPDVEVSEGSIRRMVDFMDAHPRAGISGAKLVYPDGSLQMSCRTFYTFRTVLLRRTFLGKIFPNSGIVREHLMLDWDHNSEREVDWVIGACMMVRRDAYESLGGMDERFFLYFEDVDWCYRMKKHGWTVCYVPSAVMKHYHRRESAKLIPDRQLVAHLLSTFRFLDKWSSAGYAMKRERRLLWLVATVASDLVMITLAFVCAYYFRYAIRGLMTKPLYGLGIYRGLIVYADAVCLLSLLYFGFYRPRRRSGLVRDLVGISRALLLGSLLVIAATYLTRTITYSRAIILIFWPISVVLVTLGRAAGRAIHHLLRKSLFDLRRVAVVGEDQDALAVKDKLLAAYGGECDFVGYVVPAGRQPRPELKPVLGDTLGVEGVVVEHRLNEIYVSDKRLSRAEIGPVVIAARRAGAEVRVVSEVTDILIRGSQLDDVDGLPVVVFPPAGLAGARLATKRASDLMFALTGLMILVVLFPAVLVAQTLTYRNYRRWAGAVAKLGLVISGRMSLVGPSQQVGGEPLKPGMMGPWLGVEGLAGDDTDRLDIYYIQNWSVSYDLEIMLESSGRIWSLFGRTP
jgi:GT2 family glycosyltransferase